MKKFLLLAIAAFTFNAASAQSTMQIPAYVDTINGHVDSVLVGRVSIVNTSSQSIDVKVARKVLKEVPGSENVFCWTQCYLPSTSVSPDMETIAPGATNSIFYADYVANGHAGTTRIRYSFFRVNASAPDSVHAIITFNATKTTGTKKDLDINSSISLPKPNPANDMTAINYSLPANARNSKIKLYNAIGGLVKEVNLTDKNGVIMLVTSGLPSGIYFYTLQIDNRSVTTKKLVVKH